MSLKRKSQGSVFFLLLLLNLEIPQLVTVGVKAPSSHPQTHWPTSCPGWCWGWWGAPSLQGWPRPRAVLALLQWIFLIQRSKPGLQHCRQILYHLSHKGSPSPLLNFSELLLFIKTRVACQWKLYYGLSHFGVIARLLFSYGSWNISWFCC